MAHFVKLDLYNIVVSGTVIDNLDILDSDGMEQESLGQDFIKNVLKKEGMWLQTSYHATFRKNYAGIGYLYDKSRDAFISPKPFPSYVLNEDTCRWESPTPYPTDGKIYIWKEETLSWVEMGNK